MRLLFVCMGNICRSPTAEGVMRHLLREAGRDDIGLDSAGTGAWHAGDPPDARSAAAAARRGITLEGSARQVRPSDFSDFDLVLAADTENLAHLRAMAPEGSRAQVRLLRDFDPDGPGDVPDPYPGGARGFEDVLDIVERSCRGLLATL